MAFTPNSYVGSKRSRPNYSKSTDENFLRREDVTTTISNVLPQSEMTLGVVDLIVKYKLYNGKISQTTNLPGKKQDFLFMHVAVQKSEVISFFNEVENKYVLGTSLRFERHRNTVITVNYGRRHKTP
jgi:hypothetical protein